MGRHRKHNRHLPRGVTLERGSYFYRGPDRKRVNLGRDFSGAMIRYGEMFRDAPLSTVGAVLDRYLQLVVPKKAARTQRDYARYAARVRPVIGHMTPRSVKPEHVVMIRDKIAATSGDVQANRHLEFVKAMFSKAVEWGALPSNPAREIRKLRMKPRERYVSDDEFAAVYAAAPPAVQIAMDLAVLTGLRRADLLALTRANLRDDGIHVATGKTGRRLIVRWSDELEDVIKRAGQIRPQAREHLIARRDGKPFSGDGFSSVFRRAVQRAIENGTLVEGYTFHDLRAKNVSDDADVVVASERAGHATLAITRRVYRRRPTEVRPLLRELRPDTPAPEE